MAAVRDYRTGDARGVAALLRANRPPELYVMTAAGIEYRIERLPARAAQRVWVAEEGGSLVGWARALLRWAAAETGIGRLEVEVARAARRRGVGGELLTRAEEHLRAQGVRRIECAVPGDEEGLGFARRRGYGATRRELFSWLEPRRVDVPVPQGVLLSSLRGLGDRLEDAWLLEAEAIEDVPADETITQVPFDEWIEETVEHPDLDHDGSVYALVGDRLAAYVLVSVDRERRVAWNEMTGTAPEFRRRGLARLVKLASIRWAAGAGIRSFSTGNDLENAAMLALNRELGYRPLLEATEVAKAP